MMSTPTSSGHERQDEEDPADPRRKIALRHGGQEQHEREQHGHEYRELSRGTTPASVLRRCRAELSSRAKARRPPVGVTVNASDGGIRPKSRLSAIADYDRRSRSERVLASSSLYSSRRMLLSRTTRASACAYASQPTFFLRSSSVSDCLRVQARVGHHETQTSTEASSPGLHADRRRTRIRGRVKAIATSGRLVERRLEVAATRSPVPDRSTSTTIPDSRMTSGTARTGSSLSSRTPTPQCGSLPSMRGPAAGPRIRRIVPATPRSHRVVQAAHLRHVRLDRGNDPTSRRYFIPQPARSFQVRRWRSWMKTTAMLPVGSSRRIRHRSPGMIHEIPGQPWGDSTCLPRRLVLFRGSGVDPPRWWTDADRAGVRGAQRGGREDRSQPTRSLALRHPEVIDACSFDYGAAPASARSESPSWQPNTSTSRPSSRSGRRVRRCRAEARRARRLDSTHRDRQAASPGAGRAVRRELRSVRFALAAVGHGKKADARHQAAIAAAPAAGFGSPPVAASVGCHFA